MSPNEGHTRATCNACNTRSTNDDTCDTCFTSVNACKTSVNTSVGVKRRRETRRKFANRIFSRGKLDKAIGGIRALP